MLFVPGNHDDFSTGNGSSATLDLGVLQVFHKTPFELLAISEVAFLCIPHQHDYRHHQEWSVPPKKAPFRIALAHGIVSGINIYARPTSLESGYVGTIDPDIFNRFNFDYAPMGHIHSRRNEQFGQTWISYPGSSRVWGRGETGSRGLNAVTLNQTIQVKSSLLQWQASSGTPYSQHRRKAPVSFRKVRYSFLYENAYRFTTVTNEGE